MPMEVAFVERQARNQKKYEVAAAELETTTSSALSLFRSFDTTGNILVANMMETYALSLSLLYKRTCVYTNSCVFLAMLVFNGYVSSLRQCL